jgi:hypothetical protein
MAVGRGVRGRRAPAALVMLVILTVALGLGGRTARADEPTIRASATAAGPGTIVLVTLSGWLSPVVVAVCGNDALRGAVDCDQTGSVGVAASQRAPETRQLTVTAPPAPCPCVLRASGPGEQLVRTIPFEVVGVSRAPLTRPPGSEGPALRVTARLASRSLSFGDRARSALGGPTRRVLELTVTNTGSTPLTDVSITAAVGRDSQSGDPLQPPNLDPLPPGQTRRLDLPVRLSTPSFGRYVVFGTAYGGGVPVSFAASTRTMPWALVVIALLLVADVVAVATLRLRRRSRDRGTYMAPLSRDYDLQVNES